MATQKLTLWPTLALSHHRRQTVRVVNLQPLRQGSRPAAEARLIESNLPHADLINK
jgi:hypothetical protein